MKLEWVRSLSASARLGITIVGMLLLLALFGPELTGDPDHQDLALRLQAPAWSSGDWSHPLGTDQLGRDLLARIAAGTRLTLTLGVVVTSTSLVIGVALGLLAGYRSGLSDVLIRFLVDVQIALPVIVIAIAASALFEPSFRIVFLVLLSTGWIAYQRVVRVQIRSLRGAPFVEASRSIGATSWWVASRHLLPNVSGSVAVLASQQIGAVILFEAALSYLGLGMPPSAISWGRMIADGREALLNAWWVSVIPGCFIALAVLGFNFLGDSFGARRRR